MRWRLVVAVVHTTEWRFVLTRSLCPLMAS